jgi:hypothetical protein
MDIERLIGEIIPPSDYQYRNGFNNIPIINKLTDDEKKQVEDILVNKLSDKANKEVDTLIVETLAYLKSRKSLPVLKDLLKHSSNEVVKLRIATSIFEINQDNDMVDIAINSFKKLDNNNDPYYVYKLTSAFFYLIKFNKPEVNELIKKYINHKDFLLSYNAKRVLGMQ